MRASCSLAPVFRVLWAISFAFSSKASLLSMIPTAGNLYPLAVLPNLVDSVDALMHLSWDHSDTPACSVGLVGRSENPDTDYGSTNRIGMGLSDFVVGFIG